MPRKPRLFVPNTFVHIMARGIEGRDIFLDDQDRSLFLALLGSGLRTSEYRLHAWALMKNHYHLLVRTSEHPLSDLMRRLNSTYARHFSRKCGRRGYLFQDRYKSLVTQDQHYVEALLRYVHLNPVRAGVCANIEELNDYRWTGHAVLMNRHECLFQDTWTVLRRFGRTVEHGRIAYRNFMEQGVDAGNESVDEIGSTVRRADTGLARRDEPDRWVIDDSDFVNKVLALDKESRLRLARHCIDNVTIEDIAVKVCAAFSIEREQLRRRTRATRLAEIRKVFAHLCRSGYGFAVVDIGCYLGTSGPPMSVRITEGSILAKKAPYNGVLEDLWP